MSEYYYDIKNDIKSFESKKKILKNKNYMSFTADLQNESVPPIRVAHPNIGIEGLEKRSGSDPLSLRSDNKVRLHKKVNETNNYLSNKSKPFNYKSLNPPDTKYQLQELEEIFENKSLYSLPAYNEQDKTTFNQFKNHLYKTFKPFILTTHKPISLTHSAMVEKKKYNYIKLSNKHNIAPSSSLPPTHSMNVLVPSFDDNQYYLVQSQENITPSLFSEQDNVTEVNNNNIINNQLQNIDCTHCPCNLNQSKFKYNKYYYPIISRITYKYVIFILISFILYLLFSNNMIQAKFFSK